MQCWLQHLLQIIITVHQPQRPICANRQLIRYPPHTPRHLPPLKLVAPTMRHGLRRNIERSIRTSNVSVERVLEMVQRVRAERAGRWRGAGAIAAGGEHVNAWKRGKVGTRERKWQTQSN